MPDARIDRAGALLHGLIGLLCLSLLTACSARDDTEQIQGLIAKGAESAEAHAIGDLIDLTAPGLLVTPGSHDAAGLKPILFAAFRHYGRFKIHYPRPGIEFSTQAGEAESMLHFLIVRQDQEMPGLKELVDDPQRWLEAASEKADLYQLKLGLIKQDGEWKVRRAHLEGFKGTGF